MYQDHKLRRNASDQQVHLTQASIPLNLAYQTHQNSATYIYITSLMRPACLVTFLLL